VTAIGESLEQKQDEAEEYICTDTESLEQRQDRLEKVTSMAVEYPLQERAEEDIREGSCPVIEADVEEHAKEVGEEKEERCVEKGKECERTVKEEPDEESGQEEAEPTTCFIEEDPLSR
jgi:poly(A) polymerase Pap1